MTGELMNGIALTIFTAVLVGATVYYAKKTKRMVEEMGASRAEARASRKQGIRPKLVLALVYRKRRSCPTLP